MSADYDRLFHSSEAAQAEEETAAVDRDVVAPVSPAPAEPSPAAPTQGQAAPMPTAAPPPRATEVTMQMPPSKAGAPRVQNGLMRSPQGATPTGARYEQRPAAPAPQARSAAVPSPQHSAEAQAENRAAAWASAQPLAGPPGPTSAATIGNHRAIDALSHVGVRSAVKMPSQRGWRHIVYMLTRINLGV